MLLFKKVFVLVYDDEGENKGEENKGGEQKPTLKKLIEEHELQDELNTMMASNRKTLAHKNTDLVQQLQNLRDQESISVQAKEELESRIEQLQTQYMSSEELAKRESEKQGKTHKSEIEKLQAENIRWQGLYSSSTTQRSLLDAAVEGGAIRPAQIVSMLGPNTHIVEELDGTGKGVNKFKTIVKFNDIDSEGNIVVLELSPNKAISRMKELTELYGNLFKGGASGGLGGNNTGTPNDPTPKLSEILKDPKKYQKWRKENPDLDISKLRS